MTRATSLVRSFPAIPRMSYSRKIARERSTAFYLLVDGRNAGLKTYRHSRCRTGRSRARRTLLAPFGDGVGEDPEHENEDRRRPDDRPRQRSGTGGKDRILLARLHEHHHHHVQVVAGAYNARENENDGELRLWRRRLQCRLDDVPLGEEPDTAENRETEEREHEYRHRNRERRIDRPEPRIAPDVEIRLAHFPESDDHAKGAKGRERVREQVEQCRRTSESISDHESDEDVAGMSDARIREHALDVLLRESDDVADNHRRGGDPPDGRVPLHEQIGESLDPDSDERSERCRLDRRRHVRGNRGRRAVVDVRRPHVKRDGGDLEAEP